MNKIYEYTQNAVDYAQPYVKKAGKYATDAAHMAKRTIKKTNKKAKRHLLIYRIKNTVEIVSNLILIIAAIIALLGALNEYFKNREN